MRYANDRSVFMTNSGGSMQVRPKNLLPKQQSMPAMSSVPSVPANNLKKNTELLKQLKLDPNPTSPTDPCKLY